MLKNFCENCGEEVLGEYCETCPEAVVRTLDLGYRDAKGRDPAPMERFIDKFWYPRNSRDFELQILDSIDKAAVAHLPGMWELLSAVIDGDVDDPPDAYWEFMVSTVEECGEACAECGDYVYNRAICSVCEGSID